MPVESYVRHRYLSPLDPVYYKTTAYIPGKPHSSNNDLPDLIEYHLGDFFSHDQADSCSMHNDNELFQFPELIDVIAVVTFVIHEG